MLRVALAASRPSFVLNLNQQNLAPRLLGLWLARDTELAARLEVRTFDLESAAAEQALRDFAPDVLGLSCYLWSTRQLIETAARLHAERSEMHVVLGGPDADARPELLLRRHTFVDGVALGDGEEPLRLLLRRLVGLDAASWRHTPGFVVRSADSGDEPIWNPPSPPPALDELPSLLDLPEFDPAREPLLLQAGRGCRYRCAYCQYNSLPRRVRSLGSIREELRRYVEGGGTSVAFLDSAVNQESGRLRPLLEAVAEHPGLALQGPELVVERLEEQDVALLARLTRGRLGIGLQTTHPPTLRNLNRPYDARRFRANTDRLRTAGVSFSLDIIYGLPGDDYDTYKQTLDQAYDHQPALVLAFRLQVLPGSPLARAAERWGYVFDPEPPYYAESCHSFTASDMRRARRMSEANDLLHRFTFDSTAFQEVFRAHQRRPSECLEHFLAGAWRGGLTVTDEELFHWHDPDAFDDWWHVARRWLHHLFDGQPPAAVVDRVEVFLASARANLHARDAVSSSPAGNDQLAFRLAPHVALVSLAAPFEERGDEGEVDTVSHVLTEGSPTEGIATRYLSPLVGRVLSAAGSGLAAGVVLDEALGDFDEPLRGELRSGLLELIEEQAAQGTLRWETEEPGARVLLFCPPFQHERVSSLSTALLAAVLREQGVPTAEAYVHFDLLRLVGYATYTKMTEGGLGFTGELLFAEALHGPTDDQKQAARLESLFGDAARRRSLLEEFASRCLGHVERERPTLVGLTTTIHQLLPALFIARRVKEAYPDVVVVLGGASCAAPMGSRILAGYPFVDYVVSGAGEFPLLELARGKRPTDRFIRAQSAPELDQLPRLDYSSFVAQAGELRKHNIHLAFESSRGCWWGRKRGCSFCGLNARDVTFREKSSRRVVSEVRELWERYGFHLFATDTILARRHLKEVIPQLAEYDTQPALFYEVKANLTEAEVVALRRANVQLLQPGIESLSGRLLRLLNKGTSPLRNLALLKWCREQGIRVLWNQLFGVPGETAEDYQEQLALIDKVPQLPPPLGSGAVRIDRFSPYCERYQDFGYRSLEPFPEYRLLHPHFDDQAVHDVAYHFRGDGVVFADSMHEPFEAAVERWERRHAAGEGFFVDPELGLIRCDARGRHPFPLPNGMATVLERAHSIAPVAQVLAEANASRSCLDELEQEGLLYVESGRVLNLAVRLSPNATRIAAGADVGSRSPTTSSVGSLLS